MEENSYTNVIRSCAEMQTQLCQTQEARKAVQLVAESMESVGIDNARLARSIEQILNDPDTYAEDDGGGLFKIIQKIFLKIGVRITPKDTPVNPGSLDSIQRYLRVDQSRLNNAMSNIRVTVDNAKKLAETDKKRADEIEKHLSASSRNAESARAERDFARQEQEESERDVLRFIQKMLAEKRSQAVEPDPDDALHQLLDFLNLTYSWDVENEPQNFTVYKISDPSRVGLRTPCLIRDETLIMKGLQYVLSEEPPRGADSEA